jgi:hypothetical protein
MKWSARGVAAMPYYGPLQLLVRRLARRLFTTRANAHVHEPKCTYPAPTN